MVDEICSNENVNYKTKNIMSVMPVLVFFFRFRLTSLRRKGMKKHEL
jgi:hypothetical protein